MTTASACAPLVGVMRGGALGDFVLTLPAIAALRAAHPECRLALLAHARYAVLASPDLVVDLDGAAVAGLYAAPPTGGGAAATGAATLDAGLQRLLGRTRLLLAYSTDSSGRLADNLSRWTAGQVHVADPRPAAGSLDHQTAHLAAPLRVLGVPVRSLVPRVSAALLGGPAARTGPPSPGPSVLLHPGSGGQHKRWPLASYLRLAGRLRREGCRVTLVCGPAEEQLHLSDEAPPLRPATPLELAAALARADLFVGNDSGPAHLAAAVATPTLALFGPTDPRVWGPAAPWARTLRPKSGELASLGVDCVLEEARSLLTAPCPRTPAEDG